MMSALGIGVLRVGVLHDQSAVGADTLLLNAVTGQKSFTAPTDGRIRGTVQLAGGGIFRLTVNDGTAVEKLPINTGSALTASVAYTFVFDAIQGYIYDFDISTNVGVDHLAALFDGEGGG